MSDIVSRVEAQLGPVFVLRSEDGHWRWWCSADNAISQGSILPSTSQHEVIRLAQGHLHRRHRDSFTCPRCGRTSWNPNDLKHGYCGACHDYTGVPQ
jgi:hypothetical protein